jgi:tryptophan synthase alpha chain
MTRLAAAFERIRRARQPGLVTYTTAGDPTLERSIDVLLTLARAGADVLEVGVPFSDPVADGPVIERAAERGRASGGTLATTLEVCRRVRAECDTPMVLFTYANPVLRMGVETFAEAAARAGVDGALLLDLPLEEAHRVRPVLVGHGLDMIFLISPTTTDDRIEQAAELGSGFLYVISRLGVTGARDQVSPQARELVARVRAKTTLPIAVGFGVSRPEHVEAIGRWADAAVVGSALVSVVAEAGDSEQLVSKVDQYVRWLAGGSASAVSRP